MHTFLLGNSSDETKQRNIIIQCTEIEILLLHFLFGSSMIWCHVIKFLEPLLDWNTIRESEWFIL
jgi:hypothetical protein